MKLSNFKNVVLFSGIVLSIAVGVILWLAGEDTVQAVIVGLLVSVISLLSELLLRTDRHNFEVAELSKLSATLYTFPKLYNFVFKAISDYTKIAELNNEIFIKYAHSYMVELNASLHTLSEGRYQVPPLKEGEGLIDSTILLNTQNEFLATSIGNLERWWNSVGGKRYLHENELAVKRGVKLTRIFIVQKHDNLEAVAKIATEQKHIGVDVWLIDAEHVPEHLRLDYIISERKTMSYGEVSPDGMLRKPVISINDYDIQKYINNFEIVKRYATNIDEWMVTYKFSLSKADESDENSLEASK